MTTRTFRRLSEVERRDSLLDATLLSVADHGLHGASTRKIAEAAGVSAGLIRHYFASKDEMLRAAYAYLMEQLTEAAARSADVENTSPAASLTAFIVANLSPPNLSSFKLSLWATFIGAVRSSPDYATIHREAYREFLSVLSRLISRVLEEQQRNAEDSMCWRFAIALNGLIDGLWLEGSLEHGLYDPAELAEIGVSASESLLRLPPTTLTQHLPAPN